MKTSEDLQHPWRRPSARVSFTLIELLVVAAIVVVMGCILLPRMSHEKHRAMRISCTSRLKQIGLSFKVWGIDNQDLFPAQRLTNQNGVLEPAALTNADLHFLVMSNELSTPIILVCPADTARIAKRDFTNLANTNISYFVGLDARDDLPQMFLSGDRNLTNGLPLTNNILYLATNRAVGWTRDLHRFQGNVGLADGSVQQFSPFRLSEAATNSGAPNRLLMP